MEVFDLLWAVSKFITHFIKHIISRETQERPPDIAHMLRLVIYWQDLEQRERTGWNGFQYHKGLHRFQSLWGTEMQEFSSLITQWSLQPTEQDNSSSLLGCVSPTVAGGPSSWNQLAHFQFSLLAPPIQQIWEGTRNLAKNPDGSHVH